MDLERSPGHITLSKAFTRVADTADTALAVVDAFLRTNADCLDRWWALVRNGKLLKTDTTANSISTSAAWDEDSLANSPTDARDMTIHENDSDSASGQNRLFVTRDSDIAVLNDTAANTWNANWWVTTKSQSSGLALKTGYPHPIEYFPLKRITLVGDKNLVHTIDKNEAVTHSRLILPFYLQVEHIFVTTYRAWILCSNQRGGNGAIIEWDGSAETYNRIHDAQSTHPLSGVNYNEIPIVINNRGMILEYNGNGFVPMVRNGQQIAFPIYEELGNVLAVTSNRPIKPRGMTLADDGLIYINAKQPGLASQRQFGGIYCLNPITGNLYSKYSLGNGGDTDFGQQFIGDPGAIKAVGATSLASGGDYLVAGGEIFQDDISSRFAIWNISRNYTSTNRRGHFITQYIPAENVQDWWDSLWVRFGAFRSSEDRIIIKARGVNPLLDANRRHLQGTITWTAATTFTVTLSASDDSLSVGDEIEVILGKNAGTMAHITVISGVHGALQTITIDETVSSASGTAYVRFDRWKKLGVINNTSKYVAPLNIGIQSSFIQFKVELRGPASDFEISNLVVNPDPLTISKR